MDIRTADTKLYLILSGDLKEENYTNVAGIDGWDENIWLSIEEQFPFMPEHLPSGTIKFYEKKMIQVGNTAGPSEFFRFRDAVFVSRRLAEKLSSLVQNLRLTSMSSIYNGTLKNNEYFAAFFESIEDAVDWETSAYLEKYGCRCLERLVLDQQKISDSADRIFWVKDDNRSVLIAGEKAIAELTKLRGTGFRGFNLWKTNSRLFSYFLC